MDETTSTTRCLFGVARRDVTPPVGIYARSWGAATHDAAERHGEPLYIRPTRLTGRGSPRAGSRLQPQGGERLLVEEGQLQSKLKVLLGV